MKTVIGTYNAPQPHWVGDGFPVRTLFSYHGVGSRLSPFLLLDYAGPVTFSPSRIRRGVGQHPHRGFETVTIVYQGELEHRDSTGAGGTIGAGDVQWMTAGAGIMHEEMHSSGFSQEGGTLEMIQLWVNLPRMHKMTRPRYQTLLKDEIPVQQLPADAGSVRLIAGQFGARSGAASTFTEMDVWDLRLNPHIQTVLPLKQGRSVALIVLRGEIVVGADARASEGQWVLLDAAGENVELLATMQSIVLVLSGEPINEPIVGYGPFVMNSREEIQQAMEDLRSGKFGSLESVA